MGHYQFTFNISCITHYLRLWGWCSFLRPSLTLVGFPGSRGWGGLPPSRGFGGLTPSVKVFGGLPGWPGGTGLGIFLGGPLSLRGGGSTPGFNRWLKEKNICMFQFACSIWTHIYWAKVGEQQNNNQKIIKIFLSLTSFWIWFQYGDYYFLGFTEPWPSYNTQPEHWKHLSNIVLVSFMLP